MMKTTVISVSLRPEAFGDANGVTGSTGFLIDAGISGDANGDGTFDLGDLAAYNALLPGPESAVLEPSSLALLGIALVSCLGCRKRRFAV